MLNLMDTLTAKYNHALKNYLESIVDKLYTLIQ